MNSDFFKSGFEIVLKKQPEAVVMPCRCGRMPAPVTNVFGDERRRCCECFCRESFVQADFGES